MHFDIPTLLITVALSTLICAAARALLWRLHPTISGLGQWALACLLGGFALILVAARGSLPEFVSVTLAQILVSFSFIIAWDGFRGFLEYPPLPRQWRILIWLSPVALALLPQSLGAIPLRPQVNSGVMILFSSLIAWNLLRRNTQGRPARRLTGGLYLLNALFILVRAITVRHEPGTLAEMQDSGMMISSLIWWMSMTLSITLGMVLMTSEILREHLDRQASIDPLTGAMNRRAFGHLATRELARARRSNQPLSLLMMDLDHFKQINDRLGHASGDIVLRLFVSVAQRILRQEDIFCRWGGEEFVTLLPATTLIQAMMVAERLRQSFAAEAADLGLEDVGVAFTVSLGVGQRAGDEDLEDLLRRTDEALYRAKSLGRNRSETAQLPLQSAQPQMA